MLTINLSTKLIAQNRRVLAADTVILDNQSKLDAQIEKLRLGAEQTFKDGKTLDVAAKLGFDYKTVEAARVNRQNAATSHLPQDRVFTLDAIKSLCLTYGLRFLPTPYYKGALDDGIPAAVAEFEALNKGHEQCTAGPQFFIAAPTASFALTARPKDPLLFASLSSDRFYLIHKWGDDLSVTARLKNISWQFVLTAIAVITGIAICLAGFLVHNHDMAFAGPLVSVIAGMFTCMFLDSDIGFFKIDKNRVTGDNWNSPFSNA